jgi:hypothetical protein
MKADWFETLNDALESEELVDSWPAGVSMGYGQRYGYTYDDGTRHGHYVSVYRSESGRYERPIHYAR